MSGFSGPAFLTAQNFHRPSFLVGFAVARIWNEYSKAYVNDRRRAALALGDYLWRLSEGWQQAKSNEDAVKIAVKIRFKLIDLKKARATLAVLEMEREYDELLSNLQRIFGRKHPLTPGEKRLSLFSEISKVLP